MSESKTKTKTICVIVSNNNKEIGPENGKWKTGWYLPEVAHPIAVFKKSGIKLIFASPTGGNAPCDESSLQWANDPACKEFLESKDFNLDVKTVDNKVVAVTMKNTLKPSEVNFKDIAVVFYAGGFGPMFDMPDSQELAKLSANLYEAGGIVSAVCHGPAGLLNIKLSNGTHLLKGKTVTGFSNSEEEQMGLSKQMPFSLENELKKHAGESNYKCVAAWSENVVTSDRLVTGQNPSSASAVAKELLKILGSS